MSGQPEIIIRSQVDDFLSIERTHRRLFIFEHAQIEVCALRLELVQLICQVGKRIGASRSRHHSSPRANVSV